MYMERQPFPQAHAFLVICLFKQMQARNTCLLKTHVYNNNFWLVGWGLTALLAQNNFWMFYASLQHKQNWLKSHCFCTGLTNQTLVTYSIRQYRTFAALQLFNALGALTTEIL